MFQFLFKNIGVNMIKHNSAIEGTVGELERGLFG